MTRRRALQDRLVVRGRRPVPRLEEFLRLVRVEMPDRVAEDLVMFVRQNKGTLPENRRRHEFKALTDDEVTRLERIVRDAFDGFAEDAGAAGVPTAR
jgi:hypothetical protein